MCRLLQHGSTGGRAGLWVGAARAQSSAPEKIEVFIDDQPVMVAPGTTVLQVGLFTCLKQFFNDED